jgi:hypothetical protein
MDDSESIYLVVVILPSPVHQYRRREQWELMDAFLAGIQFR